MDRCFPGGSGGQRPHHGCYRVAEVFVGRGSGSAPGCKGCRDGEGGERQPAVAPSSGSQLIARLRFSNVFNSGDLGQRSRGRHQGFHFSGRPGAVRCQGAQFQQDGPEVAGVFHAGVGQQFVDDPLVPG
jgi:hypothetical protein